MSQESLINLLEKAHVSKFHYSLLTICCLIYGFTAMNVMLISAALPAITAEWHLSKVAAGLLLSSGYAGMFVGALSCGIIADLIGRKKALLLTLLMASIFTGVCAVAWDINSMAFFRFLAGVGLGGSLPQPGVYISEYVPASRRGKFLGLTETSWVYGALLAAIFPYFLIPSYGWRLTFLVAFIPLLLVPLIIFSLPESIRYLELKGKSEEALTILKKVGLIQESLTTIEKTIYQKYSLRNALKELWSKEYRRRTLVLWVTWAVLVYTYHGIFLWLPSIYVEIMRAKELIGPLYWYLIITLMQVPGYYSATFLLDPSGRKPVLIGYLALAGFGSYMFAIAKGLTSILIWSAVVSFFNLGAWSGLYTYTPELYPTRIRGTGAGAAASMGRLAGIAAPTITGYIWAIWGLSSAFIVFASAHFIAALIVASLGIETKRKMLEEISK
ncbi:MAG: MFS transporter [Candidatus Bathyarchaeia archaeon]